MIPANVSDPGENRSTLPVRVLIFHGNARSNFRAGRAPPLPLSAAHVNFNNSSL
jgi:hypothetical protein